MTNKSYETGIASEFLVLSNLYRLKADAVMSMGNKKAVDIYIHWSCGRTIYVDVKSVQGTSAVPVDNIINGKRKNLEDSYVVFVLYEKKFSNIQEMPSFYIVSQRELIENKDNPNYCYRSPNGLYRVHPKKHWKNSKDRWELIVEHYPVEDE
ncbi:MAG: hypothetical protein SOY65_04300 [Marinifilaceae bacterium]|nr:hypothetical protein [Marinifilaceae bacterium]